MNLLLVSIDSLRLDFVSRTRPQVRTPRFDRQVAGCGFSERCFSVSSATRPVHTTLFTGLYPFEHGILGQRSPLMRPGIPHLFDLFRQQGWKVGGFSEAREVFAGLSYSQAIEPLVAEPEAGLRQLEAFLPPAVAAPTFLFVHYWSVHTPYGAADNRAFGEVGQLLAEGRVDRVQERYIQAVQELFEHKLAPLLARLDRRQWAFFILSDHGESWTPDEPYHGQSLRNAVLRVPFYFHIPFSGNHPPSRPLISLVDLVPTFAALFALPVDYQGFGREIWGHRGESRTSAPSGPDQDLKTTAPFDYYLAQIHPIASDDDLGLAPSIPLVGGGSPGPQWTLFDAERKFTYVEKSGEGRLERTLTEEQLDEEGAAAIYLQAFAELQKKSSCTRLPLAEASRAQEDLLTRRLRALGYLA